MSKALKISTRHVRLKGAQGHVSAAFLIEFNDCYCEPQSSVIKVMDCWGPYGVVIDQGLH